MPNVNPLTDTAATEFIRSRLPEGFLVRLPAAIREGYHLAIKTEAPPHIKSRWGACDRYWTIQSEWKRLGDDFQDVNVIEAAASNGGGPFYVLEYEGLMMTVHKVDDENSAPRPAAYRSHYSMNSVGNQTIEQLAMLPILDEVGQVLDHRSQETVNALRDILQKSGDLYMLITHSDNDNGEVPRFIHAVVINPQNEILATVDLAAEAQAVIERRISEEIAVVDIQAPSPKKRSKRQEASEE